MQTPQPSLNVSSMGGGSIAHILQLLDDQAADEEERIENVRSAFGDALEEVEGARAVSMRCTPGIFQGSASHSTASVPFAS